MPQADAVTDPWDEVQAVLDDELSQLPDKSRSPILLCDLEGKMHREAARPARLGSEEARDRPCSVQNVLATVYYVLGINPARTFPDRSGRPVHLPDDREPVRELL